MRWVQDGNRNVPELVFEPEINLPPGTCKHCGGRGSVPETIDEERYDVLVPCWNCQTYCKACDRHVKKTGHECQGAKP